MTLDRPFFYAILRLDQISTLLKRLEILPQAEVGALVNLAVAMAILPTKGLTLPFVSYGGSSLLVNAAAAGVLLNISRQRAPAPASSPSLESTSVRPKYSGA